MPELIRPDTLKGFRDVPPGPALAREEMIAAAKAVFRDFGFAPIETPALEYAEVLLGKGGEESDRQTFRFTDQGGRDVAMRFDLTVPFARFAAKHHPQIGLPFRRYQVGTVWRGERPQKGRYREFTQCDFDTIGIDSVAADAETLLVIDALLRRLGVEKFSVRLNSRGLLNGLLANLGLEGRAAATLRVLDKLAKAGREAVLRELTDDVVGSADVAEQVLAIAEIAGPAGEVLPLLAEKAGDEPRAAAAIGRLSEIVDVATAAGVSPARMCLDASIARGLDYYTGVIYETFLDDLPSIGSVCSGGRYDDLAGLFTKQPLPGVGASLGLDRLLAAWEELGRTFEKATPADVLMTVFDDARLADYAAAANRLRGAGIAVEVFPDGRGLGKQLKYANAKKFTLAVVAGPDELAAGRWAVKTLETGDQADVADADLVAAVRERLDRRRPGA